MQNRLLKTACYSAIGNTMPGGFSPINLDEAQFNYYQGRTRPYQRLTVCKSFNVKDFGAVGDGIHDDTEAIQNALRAAREYAHSVEGIVTSAMYQKRQAYVMEKAYQESRDGLVKDPHLVKSDGTMFNINEANTALACEVMIPEGKYLIAPIRVTSRIRLFLDKGAHLIATTDESKYHLIETSIAGVRMHAYPGLISVIHAHDVEICGQGTIDGNGPYWWHKYMGEDRKGGMAARYQELGLRWCASYDCLRVRNILVQDSEHVSIQGINSVASGFWNIHLLKSSDITVKNVLIDQNTGPNSDGIDIDSCSHVLVTNCAIQNNDDSICVKAGRFREDLDESDLSQDIEICYCDIFKGCGIAIGSEVSGGIRNVLVHDINYQQSDMGVRIKSARNRGGYIENLIFDNLEMHDVRYLFYCNLNWDHNYANMPTEQALKDLAHEGRLGEVEFKDYWHQLIATVPLEKGLTKTGNFRFSNIKAYLSDGAISRAFDFLVNEEEPITNVTFEDCDLTVSEYGRVAAVANFAMENTKCNVVGFNQIALDAYYLE